LFFVFFFCTSTQQYGGAQVLCCWAGWGKEGSAMWYVCGCGWVGGCGCVGAWVWVWVWVCVCVL
jgi:hypothetical protein